MIRGLLGSRLEYTLRTAAVAFGDGVAIALFAVAGQLRHGGGLVGAAETFVQFGLAWVVAAVVVGDYATGALSSTRRAAGLAIGTWAVAVGLGGLVRALTEPGAQLDPVFLLVSFGVGGVLLAAWRTIAAQALK